MREIWKNVVGFEDWYEVSSYGRVRSVARTLVRKDREGIVRYKSRLLSICQRKITGHCYVVLSRQQIYYTRYVHRLVLEAFVGPCPDGMEACHDPDRTPSNNNLNNLRWDTHKENWKDSLRHGTAYLEGPKEFANKGSSHSMAKLNESQVLMIRKLYATGNFTQAELADLFGLNGGNATISVIVNKKVWTHI